MIHCHIIGDNCMALTAKLQHIGKELLISLDSYEFYKAEKGQSGKI